MRYTMHLLAAAAVVLTARAAVAQPNEPAFEPVQSWVTDAGKTVTVRNDALELTSESGWVRSSQLYSDFVLQLDFRVPKPDGEACLGVRVWSVNMPSQRGYCVALSDTVDGRSSLGTVTSMGNVSGDVTSGLAAAPAAQRDSGEWQSVEVRADREAITVRINGAIASTVARPSEFTGYLAVRGKRGGVEIRNVRVQRLPLSATPFGQPAFRKADPGVHMPTPTHITKPVYPAVPLRAWIQGVVKLEMVVLPNGTAGDIRVVASLDPDLDQAAVACARQWRFKPGSKDGQPAPVVVELEISFTRTR